MKFIITSTCWNDIEEIDAIFEKFFSEHELGEAELSIDAGSSEECQTEYLLAYHHRCPAETIDELKALIATVSRSGKCAVSTDYGFPEPTERVDWDDSPRFSTDDKGRSVDNRPWEGSRR